MSKRYKILSKKERAEADRKRSIYMKEYMDGYNKHRKGNSNLTGYVFNVEECKKYLSSKII